MHQELPKHLSNYSEVKVKHLSSDLNKIFQEYLNQSKIIFQLQQENQSLKNKVSKLIEKNTSLEEERTSLLSELASKRRDKTATYTAGENSEPQHYLLYQDFQQLKEQDFNQVSNNIFRYLTDVDSSLKLNRKQEVAEIKSVLSQKVIINGIKLFNNDSSLLSKQSDAIESVKEALCKALNINSDALTQAFDNEIENLIKQANTHANRKINISVHACNDQQYTQAIKDISQSIYSELAMPEESLIPEPIRSETENLVKKGLELVKKIASADPPGVLWIEKEGTLFNEDRHEAMLGCEESGIILFTVYPGYLVGSRVFDKAVVYTVPG